MNAFLEKDTLSFQIMRSKANFAGSRARPSVKYEIGRVAVGKFVAKAQFSLKGGERRPYRFVYRNKEIQPTPPPPPLPPSERGVSQ